MKPKPKPKRPKPKPRTWTRWAYRLAYDLLRNDSNILETDGSDQFPADDPDRKGKIAAIKDVLEELRMKSEVSITQTEAANRKEIERLEHWAEKSGMRKFAQACRQLLAREDEIATLKAELAHLKAQPRVVPAGPEVQIGFDPDDYPLK